MQLREFQTKKKFSNTELAHFLGVHVSFITHYYKGRRNFSPQKALEIEKRTKGKVTIRDLLYPT